MLDIIFYAIPIISVVWWISNLIKYRQARRDSKSNPDIYSEEELKSIKSNLIISSVVAFVLVAIIVGLVVLFTMGIAYM